MKRLVTAMLLTMTAPAWADHSEQRDGFRELDRLLDFIEVRYEQPRPESWSWHYVNRARDYWHRDYAGVNRYLDDDWVRLEKFRTRSYRPKQQVIPVDRTIRGIGLTGMKRHANIGRAWIEFANGRIVPAEDLTGIISRGESLTREFRHPRHVKNLIVTVAPRAHRRAYLAVDLLPIERKFRKRDKGYKHYGHDRGIDHRRDGRDHHDRREREDRRGRHS